MESVMEMTELEPNRVVDLKLISASCDLQARSGALWSGFAPRYEV
jgi:hypothetical protein